MKAFLALFLLVTIYQVSGVIHVPLKNKIYVGPFQGYQSVLNFVSIGTPPQELVVTLDTGSSDFWVPGVDILAAGKNVFNNTASSTYVSLDKISSLNYITGSMAGELGKDTVTINDLRLDSVTFMYAYDMSDEPNAAGVLGLGFPKINTYHYPTFLEQLVIDGLVDESSFSFYLTSNVSYFILGGIDSKFAKSEFKYFSLTGDGFWSVMTNITMGNYTLTKNIKAVFDTGTSLMYIDPDLHRIFLKRTGINPNKKYKEIDHFESLTLHIGHETLVITPHVYMIYDSDSDNYSLGLGSEDVGKNQVLLGDLFLRAYYTHWDYPKKRIGFAEPTDPADLHL